MKLVIISHSISYAQFEVWTRFRREPDDPRIIYVHSATDHSRLMNIEPRGAVWTTIGVPELHAKNCMELAQLRFGDRLPFREAVEKVLG